MGPGKTLRIVRNSLFSSWENQKSSGSREYKFTIYFTKNTPFVQLTVVCFRFWNSIVASISVLGLWITWCLLVVWCSQWQFFWILWNSNQNRWGLNIVSRLTTYELTLRHPKFCKKLQTATLILFNPFKSVGWKTNSKEPGWPVHWRSYLEARRGHVKNHVKFLKLLLWNSWSSSIVRA